jgi:hypothetical protein
MFPRFASDLYFVSFLSDCSLSGTFSDLCVCEYSYCSDYAVCNTGLCTCLLQLVTFNSLGPTNSTLEDVCLLECCVV